MAGAAKKRQTKERRQQRAEGSSSGHADSQRTSSPSGTRPREEAAEVGGFDGQGSPPPSEPGPSQRSVSGPAAKDQSISAPVIEFNKRIDLPAMAYNLNRVLLLPGMFARKNYPPQLFVAIHNSFITKLCYLVQIHWYASVT
ncbi:hypothetical protein L228DRAFT_242162 [Xylona heveae TC161]|uniref:Uncharacterized protein n=1 Tax=Xylona heveae (strain CBS 132557 / TC161) TaxID=1328760 RepID=A0A164ZA86_XYLHT|nr:hypothetical protein L228DRAFT_242162 [Xylona heveae TC161]KZF18862.1 hypothetical protein L228DRAFT_242162 [Xylona heveae TC161]